MKSKEELPVYIREDWKRNMHTNKYSLLLYLFRLFCHSDSAYAFRYLKALRKYEYSLLYGNAFVRNYRKWWFYRLSAKYDIRILPNTVGYGLYLPHVIGGG